VHLKPVRISSKFFKELIIMDTLTALHSRISSPRLTGEVSEEQLLNIYKAALRAPDHAQLKPWRFLIIKADGRNKLGDLFAQAALEENPEQTAEMAEKARSKPLRAPIILVCIAKVVEHNVVPEIEQILSCGSAVQNMLLAAYAQGVGAMWRTGGMAYNDSVKKGLEIKTSEKIIGYLYLGQIDGRSKNVPVLDVDEYFAVWDG